MSASCEQTQESTPNLEALMSLVLLTFRAVVLGGFAAFRGAVRFLGWQITSIPELARFYGSRYISLPSGSLSALRRRFARCLIRERLIMPSGCVEAFPRLELRMSPE